MVDGQPPEHQFPAKFMAALQQHLLLASSTLRELYCIVTAVTALAHLFRGGRHKVIMDNLCCVFIMDGVVPDFATWGSTWGDPGEFVSGVSPNLDLQRLAMQLLDIQIKYDFSFTSVWVPLDQNIRVDYLSHASEAPPHDTVCGRSGSLTSMGYGAPTPSIGLQQLTIVRPWRSLLGVILLAVLPSGSRMDRRPFHPLGE
jgi:hypothetical protein